MAAYKVGVLLLNLVPYAALSIVALAAIPQPRSPFRGASGGEPPSAQIAALVFWFFDIAEMV